MPVGACVFARILTFRLPGELLKYGERDSVVEFLERFARANVTQHEQLLRAAAEIRNGEKPIWYPRS